MCAGLSAALFSLFVCDIVPCRCAVLPAGSHGAADAWHSDSCQPLGRHGEYNVICVLAWCAGMLEAMFYVAGGLQDSCSSSSRQAGCVVGIGVGSNGGYAIWAAAAAGRCVQLDCRQAAGRSWQSSCSTPWYVPATKQYRGSSRGDARQVVFGAAAQHSRCSSWQERRQSRSASHFSPAACSPASSCGILGLQHQHPMQEQLMRALSRWAGQQQIPAHSTQHGGTLGSSCLDSGSRTLCGPAP